MNRLFRILLGISVLAIALPVTAMVAPGLFSSLPWVSSSEPVVAVAEPEPDAQTSASTTPDTEESDDPQEEEVEAAAADSRDPAELNHPLTEFALSGSGDPAIDPTQAEASASNGGSQAESSSPTTAPPTTATTSAPKQALPSGGTVSLSADLVIDGGTHVFSGHIEGNGHQIMCMNGCVLQWNNFSVNNVSRLMFMNGAGASRLTNGEVTNSGVTGELGFYPIHWHLNGNSTRGTVVDNVTVRNGQNHAFVPHGSHGITIRNSAAINTIEDALWWDPASDKSDTTNATNDLTVNNLLIDGVRPAAGRGIHLAGVRLETGKGNSITNSVVRNVHGDKDCAAFHWPETANQNAGGTVWNFQNNTGSSDCHSVFVWQNDGGNHVIRNISGGGIKHGAYSNRYVYVNPNVPYFEAHAVEFTVEGGSVGAVIGASGRFEGTATFRNTQVDSFVIRNQTSKPAPVHYVFENTGLTCAEVVWEKVKPGTTVMIDGAACTQ